MEDPERHREQLISIGRFARLTDLSPRLLRKLDERGLLCPVFVDPDTRYRFYDLRQLRTANLIHLCRQLDLPPEETRELVLAPDRAALRTRLERHVERVRERLAEQDRLLRLLQQELDRSAQPLAYDIGLKDVPEVLVVSARGTAPRTHPHDPWVIEQALRRTGGAVAAEVERQDEQIDAHPIILYHTDLEVDEAMSFEICMRVTRPLVDRGGVRCWRLPATRLAFMSYRGGYDTIFHAYIELMVWVAENGHTAVGPLREQAIVAEWDTDDDTRWVTEIALPVASST